MICRFIAENRERFGVAPICRALSAHGCQIAPRTYWAWTRRAPSKRALSDLVITEVLAGLYEPDEHGRRKPESLYGSLKMWAHLQRSGITVARCTVERLMRANGWVGVRRARRAQAALASASPDEARDPRATADAHPRARRWSSCSNPPLPSSDTSGIERCCDHRLNPPCVPRSL